MARINSPRLYLVASPTVDMEASLENLAQDLKKACSAGDIASLLLYVPAVEPRTQINLVKKIAPIAQEFGTAVVLSSTNHEELVNLALRSGADGIHIPFDEPLVQLLRQQIGDDRILGVGNLSSKDDAMRASEYGADYIMFGEKRADGNIPPLMDVTERTAWWAEIFEIPCVAFAPAFDAVEVLAATKAEFIAVDETVWRAHTEISDTILKINALLGKFRIAE